MSAGSRNGARTDAAAEPLILVIDDYADLAEPLTRLLRRMGYVVETIDTGAGAIDYLMAHRPQLVILDLMLPDINGLEVLRWIRNKRGWENLPVIIYTTATESDTLHRAVTAGATEIWLKGSMDFFQIVARVETHVTRPGDPHEQDQV